MAVAGRLDSLFGVVSRTIGSASGGSQESGLRQTRQRVSYGLLSVIAISTARIRAVVTGNSESNPYQKRHGDACKGNSEAHRLPNQEPKRCTQLSIMPEQMGGSHGGRSAGKSSASGIVQYAFDIGSSVLIVVAVGGLLFTASGIWPPLVAIESGSMEPHIQKGDLVFVMEQQRFPGDGEHGDTGVVTAAAGRETGYRMFAGCGDVIVFEPGGSEAQTPIIHRAMLWVEDGERWYNRANKSFIGGADSCEELDGCPAPYAGFITKGDNNGNYDQMHRGSRGTIVKPEWVIGTAELRAPHLGKIRLTSASSSESSA